MPGSSLWLVPPADHPITNILSSLIKKTTAHFHSPHLFIPHVTLTSNINPSSHSGNPQQWLDALDLPKGEHVVVRFGNLQSEDAFFKKLYINVDKTGVQELGMRARQTVEGFEEEEKAKHWAENEYKPHNSLLYHDILKVSDAEIAEIEKLAKEAGLSLEGEGELGGWVGGRVVLVPTDQAIKDWAPIAERRV